MTVATASFSSVSDFFKNNWLFLGRFFHNPTATGSFFPSSSALASAMVRAIPDNRDDSVLRILEVGAGTGAVTDAILKKMRDDDRLDVIELDPGLAQLLVRKYVGDSRVSVCEKNILTHCSDPYDVVVSSVPHNQLPVEIVKDIFEKYLTLLKSKGSFAYYEYKYPKWFSAWLLPRHEELQRIREYKDELGKSYNEQVQSVWFNAPPARVRSFSKNN